MIGFGLVQAKLKTPIFKDMFWFFLLFVEHITYYACSTLDPFLFNSGPSLIQVGTFIVGHIYDSREKNTNIVILHIHVLHM